MRYLKWYREIGLCIKSPSVSGFSTFPRAARYGPPSSWYNSCAFLQISICILYLKNKKIILACTSVTHLPRMQEDHFVFCLAWAERSTYFPWKFPNDEPQWYVGQHSFSLFSAEMVKYIGKKKVWFVKTSRKLEGGHRFGSMRSKCFHVFQEHVIYQSRISVFRWKLWTPDLLILFGFLRQ